MKINAETSKILCKENIYLSSCDKGVNTVVEEMNYAVRGDKDGMRNNKNGTIS